MKWAKFCYNTSRDYSLAILFEGIKESHILPSCKGVFEENFISVKDVTGSKNIKIVQEYVMNTFKDLDIEEN